MKDNFDQDKIVFFDGDCNFCNSSVNFIIKHEKGNSIKFSSLQSDFAIEMLTKYEISKSINSIVFFKNGIFFFKSAAVLEICLDLKWYLRWLYIFILLPAFFRDFFYDYIAKNRYRWFGKK